MPRAMDGHVRRLLNRVSIALAAVATAALLQLFRHSFSSCLAGGGGPSTYASLSLAPFPRTSCDAASRRVVDSDLRLARFRASPRWSRRGAALSAAAFAPLRRLRLLGDSSRVLCVAAGAGQAVDAIHAAGVGDVTGVDLVDFPPLVRRADAHNLPFFDGAFDVVLSDDPGAVTGALFPSRFAAEVERTVRRGGAIVIALDRRFGFSTVARLFRKSRVVELFFRNEAHPQFHSKRNGITELGNNRNRPRVPDGRELRREGTEPRTSNLTFKLEEDWDRPKPRIPW